MNRTITLLSKPLLGLLGFFFLLVSYSSVNASHSMGADVTYTCIGNGQYLVTLKFYRDCGGISPAASYPISYSSATCGVNATFQVNQVGSAVDVTPVCGSVSTSCGGGGGSYGIEEYIYQGILTLPANCGTDWVLSWSTCCRNGAITTLSGPANQNFFVYANLDNTLVGCNSSPQFVNDPIPIVCINSPVSYSHGVSDPDGDSLVFSLGNCLTALGSSVGYGGGFSGVNPLSTSGGVAIDPATGTITFTPNSTQVGVICVVVQEFRNGVLIGETIRDMQFRVINCTNQAPTVSGIDGTANYQMTICIGSNFCFDMFSNDADNNNVNLTWNAGIPGGQISFTGQNTSSPSATFCWTPTLADVGTNFFTVTATDDACPINGVNTYSYQIDVVGTPNSVNAGTDQSFCAGQSVNLLATSTGATSYSWAPAAGLSCTNCPNPTASPTTTTNYTVTANFPDGCSLTDNVTVTVDPLPTVSVSPAVAYICPSASITLTANSPTATSYAWSNGGSGSSITVSPGSTTNFTVTVTNAAGCTDTDVVTVNVNAPTGQSCNVLYASPSGNGAGTRNDPASLSNAINMAACNNTVIKMAIGTYTFNAPITNIAGFITLEGGFDPGNNWRKTSQAGATTIHRSNTGLEGSANAQRLVAIYLNGASNVNFHDVTISTANVTSNGASTYGVHLTSCSDYTFTRTQVLPGNARQGATGTGSSAGSTGGSNGTTGLAGDCDDEGDPGHGGVGGNGGGPGSGGGGAGGFDNNGGGCCIGTGAPGNAGTDSNNSRSGGGGGGGACGGEEDGSGGSGGQGGGVNFGANQTGGGGGGGAGDPGSNGATGNSAATGATGSTGAAGPAGAHVGGFWVPGGTAGVGGFGVGGRGGVGGGGGGGQHCTFCNDGAGGGGGGGGGGGQGGVGGNGGRGGGSSYGIYLNNNGANGRIDDSNVQAGAFGNGGGGGLGALGGTGGTGANGGTATGCSGSEVGFGGRGGNGGRGGRGGTGGTGSNGQSIDVFLNSGTALALNDNNFNLSGQPVIFHENISCTNTNIAHNVGLGSSLPWDLGAGASPQNITGTNVTTQYTTVGRKNIIYGANTYTGFTDIILGTGVIPDAGTSAPIVAGEFRICEGEAVDFEALNPGVNYVYHWVMGGGSTPNNYDGTTVDVVSGAVFNTAGTYFITLQYETDCCGFSTLDSIRLIVEPQPVLAVAGPTEFCANDGVGVNLTASGASTNYTWSPSSGLNTPTGPSVTAYPTTTTTYIVTGTNAIGNCSDDQSVTVTVNDLALTPSAVAASCGANGSASVAVAGGSGSYSYAWSPLGQTTSSISGVPSGAYQVNVTDQTTGCTDSTTALVPTGPGALNAFISNVTPVTCNGSPDGSASVSFTGGTGPVFVYTWIDTLTTNAVGGNGATTTPLPAGTYAVTIFDIGNPACPGAALVTIPEPLDVNVMMVDTISPTCINTPDGAAVVNASGGTGPYTYNWQTTPAQVGDTAFGLLPGTYTVVVTDQNGCIDSVDVTLQEVGPCPLPVEMLYFTANPSFNAIRLDWETTMEENNAGFEVYRSDNGIAFESLAWVAAQGGNGVGAQYKYLDQTAVAGVKYFYRLRQVDTNGESSMSEVREALLPTADQLAIDVYPHPVLSDVHLDLDLPEDTELRIDLVNVTGQNMGMSWDFSLKAGRQTIDLDLSDLSAGMYFGKLMIDGVQAGAVKFLKVR